MQRMLSTMQWITEHVIGRVADTSAGTTEIKPKLVHTLKLAKAEVAKFVSKSNDLAQLHVDKAKRMNELAGQIYGGRADLGGGGSAISPAGQSDRGVYVPPYGSRPPDRRPIGGCPGIRGGVLQSDSNMTQAPMDPSTVGEQYGGALPPHFLPQA